MDRKLYAIVDTLAQDIVGPVITCRNEAEAVRLFTDLLAQQGTSINLHPKDHALVWLGDTTATLPERDGEKPYPIIDRVGLRVVMDGSLWLATTSNGGN